MIGSNDAWAMPDATEHQARRLWRSAEAIHAVTYFHPTCLRALADCGTRGFWMAYFVARMAPLGAVEAAVAEAVAFGFAAARPARALPDGWRLVAPPDALQVRSRAAATALDELGVPEPRPRSLRTLEAWRTGSRPGGHVLGAANRALPLADAPLERLWQLVTWLREQRGDDHVALWVAAGFDGSEANVLTTSVHGQDSDVLRLARGWSATQWNDAGARLCARGLLEPVEPADSPEPVEARVPVDAAEPGSHDRTSRWTPTAAGFERHAAIEAATDELAAGLYAAGSTAEERDELLADLERLARVVLAAGVYPFPNPMGLPQG